MAKQITQARMARTNGRGNGAKALCSTCTRMQERAI